MSCRRRFEGRRACTERSTERNTRSEWKADTSPTGRGDEGRAVIVNVTNLMHQLLERWLTIILESTGAAVTIAFEDNAEEMRLKSLLRLLRSAPRSAVARLLCNGGVSPCGCRPRFACCP